MRRSPFNTVMKFRYGDLPNTGDSCILQSPPSANEEHLLAWFHSLFDQKRFHKNPAVRSLYRTIKQSDPRTEEIVSLLPKMGEAIGQGADYLYHKVITEQIRAYDDRFGSSVLTEIDEGKKTAIRQKLIGFMLLTFFKELSERHPDSPIPSALTDGLHYEIYRDLPSKGSFVDYVTYQNPNFEDPRLAPSFKFGNDIAEITRTLDLSFSFAIAQQSPLISEVSRKLIRWVLFNEPIGAGPESS